MRTTAASPLDAFAWNVVAAPVNVPGDPGAV